MIRVLGCIFEQHDLRLVALAAGLCILACGTALSMIARARATHGRSRALWLTGAGAVAGCGIWATHFVGMLAYSIGLPLAFDPGLTVLSAAIAMVLCGVGFAAVVSRFGGAVGGIVTGSAICAMHYTGMAALHLPAVAVWDTGYLAASVLIGVSLSGLSMHFAVRGRYFLGAGLFSAAIIGMHFTGMAAVRFIPNSAIPVTGDQLSQSSNSAMDPFALAIVVAASAAFIVGQGLMVALLDRHLAQRAMGEAQRMRVHIAELEITKGTLEKTSHELSQALMAAGEANHAKSAFLASMSHELRTPLNAVIGFSETMMMEVFGPLTGKYRDYAQDIHSSGAHLLSLINDVLDLSRLDAGQGELHDEDFDIEQLIAESLRMVTGHAAKSRIHLSTDIAAELPLLRADKRRIKQILINLVSNALKFTPANGRVQVRAHLAGGALTLSVADSGIGIAAEDIPKALARFGQVDSSLSRKYDGTGLGLPLSKQFAELHGGILTLESRVHEGTTVTITLPAARLVPRDRCVAVA
jgi:signal transduction histidine kinase